MSEKPRAKAYVYTRVSTAMQVDGQLVSVTTQLKFSTVNYFWKELIIPITTRRIDLQFGLQYFLHHNNIFVFMAAGKPIFFYANLLKIGTSE